MRAAFYIAAVPQQMGAQLYADQQRFLTHLKQQPGLTVWTGRMAETNSAGYEKGVDVKIATDMVTMDYARDYEVAVLYRRRRDRSLTEVEIEAALDRLRRLTDNVDMIAPTVRLRDRAGRLLATHELSSADALQLAAALAWCEEEPRGNHFVCLDMQLREAARREGFAILPA